ncbi:MAG: hypothetical protein JSV43_00285 [Methanobacteriota archaeon]|nr:MAG: hypothetical protein JSV43_00285 [Euryarchaeota archaeon]
MKVKTVYLCALLVAAILIMPSLTPVDGAIAPPTPEGTLKKALKQIKNEFGDLLPASTWGGWDGSDAGLTSGTTDGGATPTLTFDNCTIALPANNSGTPAPTSAGVAVPQPPYTPNGQVNISINVSYVNSNLARMKVVLFHELTHVAQWRDTDGEWDDIGGGNHRWNWTKDRNLTGLKEVQSSGLTLKFIQKLMKKKEFQTKSMKDEFKREMENLQKRLKKAGFDRNNISSQDWGRDLLRKWFPRDLILLILMKKAIFYGWVTSGTIMPAELAHTMEVAEQVEDFDAYDDDLIWGDSYGQIFVEALHEARESKELRGHLVVNAVQSFYKGQFGAAMNQLNAYINHVNAQRSKLGDEVADKVLELVDHIAHYMLGLDFYPPEPFIVNPLDGAIVSGWVIVEAVETSGADDVISTYFEFSPDAIIWMEIGEDIDGMDGWWVEWDSLGVPDGFYFLRATMTDYAGNTGIHEIGVLVDNIITGTRFEGQLTSKGRQAENMGSQLLTGEIVCMNCSPQPY